MGRFEEYASMDWDTKKNIASNPELWAPELQPLKGSIIRGNEVEDFATILKALNQGMSVSTVKDMMTIEPFAYRVSGSMVAKELKKKSGIPTHKYINTITKNPSSSGSESELNTIRGDVYRNSTIWRDRPGLSKDKSLGGFIKGAAQSVFEGAKFAAPFVATGLGMSWLATPAAATTAAGATGTAAAGSSGLASTGLYGSTLQAGTTGLGASGIPWAAGIDAGAATAAGSMGINLAVSGSAASKISAPLLEAGAGAVKGGGTVTTTGSTFFGIPTSQLALTGISAGAEYLFGQQQIAGMEAGTEAYTDALKKASRLANQSTNEVIAFETAQFNKMLELIEPVRQAQLSAITDLQKLVTGPIEESETFKFRQRTGERTIERTAAARGLQRSGATLGTIEEMTSRLTGEEVDKRTGILTSLANLGGIEKAVGLQSEFAGDVGSLMLSGGATQAQALQLAGLQRGQSLMGTSAIGAETGRKIFNLGLNLFGNKLLGGK